MNQNKFNKIIVNALRTFGPLSFPEIKYIFKHDISWNVKIKNQHLFRKDGYEIKKMLKDLSKEEKIRRYECDTGYKYRYGISKISLRLDIPMKLELKIDKQLCQYCLSWVVNYFNKSKHINRFHCEKRDQIDCKSFMILNDLDKKYIIFKELFLGVFQGGNLRLPFRDFSNNEPEFFRAIKLYSRNKDKKLYSNLKLNFQEFMI